MLNSQTTAEANRHALLSLDHVDDNGVPGTGRSAFDFRYIVAAIRSNLWLIALIIAAAMAVALVATLLQTPRYTASSTIQINDSSGRILADQGDDSDVLGGGGYDTALFLKTQVDVLQSRGLALRVAQKLKLTGNPHFYASQEVPEPEAGASVEATRNAVIGLLRTYLKVNLPRDSRIVTINYESTDPELSAQIANAYASEFIQANLQRKFDSSSYARGFLSEQLEEAKKRLADSEREVNAYARQAGLINMRDVGSGDGSKSSSQGGSSVTASSLLQLNTAANAATARRIEAEGLWRSVSSGPLLSSQTVISNSTVISLLAQRASIEAALSQERARHLDDYPAVKAKTAELATVNQLLQQAATNVRNSVRAQYQSAQDAERQLYAKVSELKNDTLAEQDRTVQYGLLAREAETNRQVYDGLLERFKQLNAVAGVSLSNVSIIDTAATPGGPSSPNLFKNLLVGLLFGIGAASLTVFLKDQFDDSIRVPEDVETKLDLALLGVIPRSHQSTPDESLADPKSPISEAYNSLRGSLLYSTPEGLPQIMLVTSAQASEGKTTTSFAIASGFARMGKRTLLIDADMRRPSLHRHLDLENERGLSTLLTSHEPLADIQVPSGLENLSMVLAGPVPPSPTELLSTARFEELLQEAARSYDIVIVDSPPILGLADSPLMAALVDGVVFVVEADRSRRGSLKAALRRLRAMRPILLGAVLTKFDPLKAGNRYSEYYGYEYYQYEHSKK